LSHAIISISEQIKKRPKVGSLVVVVLTNDLMLSTYPSQDMHLHVNQFVTKVTALSQQLKALKVVLICPIISTMPSLFSYSCEDSIQIQNIRRCLYATSLVELRPFSNTGLHFEDELRHIIEGFASKISCAFQLPSIGMSKLSDLEVDLVSYSKSAEDCIHEGLSHPTLHSVASRNSVDPLYLLGQSLIVLPSSTVKAADSNAAVFRALSSVLATQDLMLIVKVPYQISCAQYWALIPPSNKDMSRLSHMVMVRLMEKEDVLRQQFYDDSAANNQSISSSDIDEYKKYIETALKSLGAVTNYNPMTCASGSMQTKNVNVSI
jgi:Ku70/Ku80 beta-barrel domain